MRNAASSIESIGRSITLVTALVPFAGCAHIIRLTPDAKWHTVISLQVQAQQVELEIEAIDSSRENCKRDRIPDKTQIRILQLESFQKLDSLPDTIEEAVPRKDGIPIGQADSGPYDLTLIGSKRIVPLITGKQILVRTWDKCTALKVTDRTPKQKDKK